MAKRDLPCRECGKLMWRTARSALEGKATCQECRRAASDWKPYAELNEAERRERWRQQWERKTGNKVTDRQVDCVTCGTTFTTSQPHAECCSRQCKNRSPKTKARAAAYRGAIAEGELFTAEQVAERDGWVCGLCDGRITAKPTWPDPRSLSIDHIVPVSEGGAHSLANVQAAHLGCNISKGNRPQGEQLRLVG